MLITQQNNDLFNSGPELLSDLRRGYGLSFSEFTPDLTSYELRMKNMTEKYSDRKHMSFRRVIADRALGLEFGITTKRFDSKLKQSQENYRNLQKIK